MCTWLNDRLWAPKASLVPQLVENPPAMRETWVPSLSWEDPLEKGKATHSSILAWKIPWTVSSMESQRVRHNSTTLTSLLLAYKVLCAQGKGTLHPQSPLQEKCV